MSLSILTRNSVARFLINLYRAMDDHNTFNGAAALAYYFFFAMFPALIFLLSLLPYLPVENLRAELMSFIGNVLPQESAVLLSDTINEIMTSRRGGLLSLGGVLTLWAASVGTYAAMRQLNFARGLRESRSFWKARGTSILLTMVLSILSLIAFVLMVFGGILLRWLETFLNLETGSVILFVVLQWLVVGVALLAGFAFLYCFGTSVRRRFKFFTPGALVGTLVIMVASRALRAYVENFANYEVTYGSIGAVIVLMLWLYIVGFAILAGGEINAMIESKWMDCGGRIVRDSDFDDFGA